MSQMTGLSPNYLWKIKFGSTPVCKCTSIQFDEIYEESVSAIVLCHITIDFINLTCDNPNRIDNPFTENGEVWLPVIHAYRKAAITFAPECCADYE